MSKICYFRIRINLIVLFLDSDLSATDFPSSVPIPAEMHLKHELKMHEEVRDYVLALSMDQQVDQTLPTYKMVNWFFLLLFLTKEMYLSLA